MATSKKSLGSLSGLKASNKRVARSGKPSLKKDKELGATKMSKKK